MFQEANMILPTLNILQQQCSKKNDKFVSGRWKPLEHEKFLEAAIIYGNDWKMIHKCVKSRSSIQARSHAQKFLLKLRKKLRIFPEPNGELSQESIDKIITEIIDCSPSKGSKMVDTSKLQKLIMGFANLIIGKDNKTSEEENTNNYPMEDGIGSHKVFHIEKVSKVKAEEAPQTNNFNLIFNNNNQEKGNNFQINQISNQNDLLKLLFPNQVDLDPSNPDKKVINIISINICNKNENGPISKDDLIANLLPKGSSLPQTSNAAINHHKLLSSSMSKIKSSIVNKNPLINNNSSQAHLKNKNPANTGNKRNLTLNKELFLNKSDFKIEGDTKSNSMISMNNGGDFYENSSSFSYFNEFQNDEEESKNLFGWN